MMLFIPSTGPLLGLYAGSAAGSVPEFFQILLQFPSIWAYTISFWRSVFSFACTILIVVFFSNYNFPVNPIRDWYDVAETEIYIFRSANFFLSSFEY